MRAKPVGLVVVERNEQFYRVLFHLGEPVALHHPVWPERRFLQICFGQSLLELATHHERG